MGTQEASRSHNSESPKNVAGASHPAAKKLRPATSDSEAPPKVNASQKEKTDGLVIDIAKTRDRSKSRSVGIRDSKKIKLTRRKDREIVVNSDSASPSAEPNARKKEKKVGTRDRQH